jgi:hypothetical protein
MTHNRYPGAQPFSDDDFSRKVFFGRQREAAILANQILANRLVVVYAKSGLGKTSLLKAGVAQRLRDEGYLPLIVRVNDVKQGPLVSVLEGIDSGARSQKVEYIPGNTTSLWNFFKTSEFWCNDLLLNPTLIIDQFEELFTLQNADVREDFLEDLGYLARGVQPPQMKETDSRASESPPSLRIVLSLREDYLGFLEEASDRIPQILDHRFRLAPLDLDAAAQAMIGPAAIDAPEFQTRPFNYAPEAVTTILSSLSRRSSSGISRAAPYVEPFQLQLICQRIEQIVTIRQQSINTYNIFNLQDFGGERAIQKTLKDFYIQEIHALPDRPTRRAVRLLCEEYLISQDGRRLSLDEHEICNRVKVSRDTLKYLVDRRLLRSDQRSDSTYYELSHDTLVEPVLATRRVKNFFLGVTGMTVAVLVFIATVFSSIGSLIDVFNSAERIERAQREGGLRNYEFHFLLAALIVFSTPLLFGAYILFQRSIRRYRRYRHRAGST